MLTGASNGYRDISLRVVDGRMPFQIWKEKGFPFEKVLPCLIYVQLCCLFLCLKPMTKIDIK